MTSSSNEPMHIISLEAEQFLRLKAVRLEPHESGLVVISGRNAQGKTSIMDAIWCGLGGEKAVPEKPLHNGAEKGSVTIDIGADGKTQYTVRRTFTDSGNSYLKVTTADGTVVKRPQDVLDGFLSAVTFDPVRFAHPPGANTPEKRRKAQVEMLLQTVPLGIDLPAHDAARKEQFEERTRVNRQIKEAEAAVAALAPAPEGAPEPIDVADLMKRVEAAEADERRHQAACSSVFTLKNQIAELEKRVAALRAELAVAQRSANVAPVDAAPLRKELEEALARNQKDAAAHAQAAVRTDRLEQLKKLREVEQALSAGIEAMDERRAAALAAAKFPIKSMTLTPDGVALTQKDGSIIPFSQASSAQQILVSFAVMASAASPLRIALVRDGNALDVDAMRTLAAAAEKYKYQVWVERVSADQPGCVVIEDGAVALDGQAKGGA